VFSCTYTRFSTAPYTLLIVTAQLIENTEVLECGWNTNAPPNPKDTRKIPNRRLRVSRERFFHNEKAKPIIQWPRPGPQPWQERRSQKDKAKPIPGIGLKTEKQPPQDAIRLRAGFLAALVPFRMLAFAEGREDRAKPFSGR